MTERGRTILTRDLGIEPEKISVIPHGIPDLPFLDPAYEKRRFGLDGRDVVLTFGLLSPNKGIEVMIAALPELVERHPDLTYVILGATHPHLIAPEGQAYRQELEPRVRALGLGQPLCFVTHSAHPPPLHALTSARHIFLPPSLPSPQPPPPPPPPPPSP